ncbi:MAG TPA: DUF5916 domain-containing protein [bacterium]|nr:DUF5916 domain-containing protein [bacterium]
MRRSGKYLKRLILLMCLFVLAAGQAVAQGRYAVPHINEQILLDGVNSEPAWTTIEPLPVVMHTPVYQGEMTRRTEVRLAYDETYLYVGARCYERPENITQVSFKRDAFSPSTDLFGILLDTFNDNENGLGFFTTPAGNRIDFSLFNDAEVTSGEPDDVPFSLSWDTFWDVAVHRNEDGWFLEMRIPLSSLRFQDDHGEVVMGIIAWRYMSRANEVHIYPGISPKLGGWSILKPSLAGELTLDGVQSSTPLYITPYLLGGFGHRTEREEDIPVDNRTDHRTSEIGLDVKYGITSNLTFDGTLNTDFAQVEADDEQVNLTRFSLFFPEKRRFFLERASIFDFKFGGRNQLFYSRRIGLHHEEQVPIYGGGRLVGRLGKWDVGVLNMQTAPQKDLDLPSENFGVLRLRRQMLNPYSYFGAMTTSRIGTGGRKNLAYGLDGIARVFGDDYLTLNWAQTFDDTTETDGSVLDAVRVRAGWERRTYEGFGYEADYSRTGAGYNPGIGFQMRHAYTRIGGGISYGWIMSERSAFLLNQIRLRNAEYFRTDDNSQESSERTISWEGQWKSGAFMVVNIIASHDDLRESFELSENTEVPPGSYRFVAAEAMHSTPAGRPLLVVNQLHVGTFYDGRRLTAGIIPTWNLSRYLSLGGFYQYNRVEFPERQQAFRAHIGRLRIEATMNVQLALSAFIQYNSDIHEVITNLRFRYNPREGYDIYLVYNEGLNTNRDRKYPVLPLTRNRTILLKYSYTFLY